MKKKIILSFIAAMILFAGCNGKKSKTKETKVESEAEDKQKEAPVVSAENIAEELEKMNRKLVEGKLVVIDHKQTLDCQYGAFGLKVRKFPWVSDNLYDVQDGDKIEVVAVVENRELNTDFIQVVIPSGETGYIKIGGSPYADGMFSVVESVEIDGKQVDFLRYGHTFNIDYGASMKALPSEDSETLMEFSKENGYAKYWPASLITADYKWVKIKYKDKEGWINVEYLSVGRGGPMLQTPEDQIDFGLIGCNLI